MAQVKIEAKIDRRAFHFIYLTLLFILTSSYALTSFSILDHLIQWILNDSYGSPL